MDQQFEQQPNDNQEPANEPVEERGPETKQPRDEYTPGSPIQKSHTGLAVFFAVVFTAIIVGGGVYLWLTYFQPEETVNVNVNQAVVTPANANKNANIANVNGKVVVNGNTNASNINASTNANANVVVAGNTNGSATASWQTYTNSVYGFSFSYPQGMAVTETLKHTYDDGSKWIQVDLDNTSAVEKPVIRFEVNSDGYGPDWNDEFYTVAYSSTSGLIVTAEEVGITSENNSATRYIAIIKTFSGTDSNSYSARVGYDLGGQDYKTIFKQMLGSFRLKNSATTNANTSATADWKIYSNAKMKYSFDYPKSWTVKENSIEQNGYNVVNVDFFNQQNQKVANLTCPVPETGMEGQIFKEQTRNITKAGTTYEVRLFLGTADPNFGATIDNNVLMIRPLDSQGNTLVGLGTDSCWLGSVDSSPDDQVYTEIYNSLK